MSGDPLLTLFAALGHGLALAGAVACAAAAVWLAGRRERFSRAGTAIVCGLFATACALVFSFTTAPGGPGGQIAEALRNLAWLAAVVRLYTIDRRIDRLAPIRPLAIVLAAIEVVQLALGGAALAAGAFHATTDVVILLGLLEAVGVLVLVHNLYIASAGAAQGLSRWPLAGMAVLFAYDLNLHAVAYLAGQWPAVLANGRGLAAVATALLVVIGAGRDRDEARLKPSREVAFKSASLVVIGAYLLGMVGIARLLAYLGGDFSGIIGLGFVTMASALAILLLPSDWLRARIKVLLAKHFFQHRYDYRAEWMRFTRTIGGGGEHAGPLGERVVRAVADIADSPAGLLLVPEEHGDFVLAARWNWPEIEVPGMALAQRDAAFFENGSFIADIDNVREGTCDCGEAGHVPDWMRDHPRAWALVPLVHFEQIVGIVLLARPPIARKLDWEDFDLLRVVGQQLASYLAENAGQVALAEASRFDDFHRRIAFVMHDIKNLASQLGLLARNAQIHAEKPAFRADMLLTLTNSAEKLNALLARLSRYGGAVDRVSDISAGSAVAGAVDRFAGSARVSLVQCEDCHVTANAESLEQVLVHLIQNGIDASDRDTPVFVSLTNDGFSACIEVVDSGCGMSPEFVRNKLFKPFVSTKAGGFGIGAFEARELVSAMRGRLEVESREGLGSRFVVRLPLCATAALIETIAAEKTKVAS